MSATLTRERLAPRRRVYTAAQRWAHAGWNVNDPAVRSMIEAGRPPMAGGAQGLNPAVFMNNAPPPGSYTIDQNGFDQQTERNDVPQPSVTWPGMGPGSTSASSTSASSPRSASTASSPSSSPAAAA